MALVKNWMGNQTLMKFAELIIFDQSLYYQEGAGCAKEDMQGGGMGKGGMDMGGMDMGGKGTGGKDNKGNLTVIWHDF